MAIRTIASPGVQITEYDQSQYATTPIETTAFLMGFADKGPTDEVLEITTFEEFESVYGTPTNAAERYFYHSAEILYSANMNVYTSRLPYGSERGEGFGNSYGALIYPISIALKTNLPINLTDNIPLSVLSSLNLTDSDEISAFCEEYNINYNKLSSFDSIETIDSSDNLSAANIIYYGSPTHVDLTSVEYQDISNNSIKWDNDISNPVFANVSSLGKAGMVILNTSQTTINNQFEGYYVGVIDNKNMEPGSNFDGILSIESINVNISLSSANNSSYVTLPETRINFVLSSVSNSQENSVSEVMENIPSYSVFGPEYYDVISLGLFKIRKSVFSPDVIKLDYSLQEAYMGSMDYWRRSQDPNGGSDIRMYIGSEIEKSSSNIKILVNDNISNKKTETWLDINGNPTRKIRFSEDCKKLFPLGSFTSTKVVDKTIGELPSKMDRVLSKIEDTELFDLDLMVEGGLGTIWINTLIGDGRITPNVDSLLPLSAVPNAENIFDDTIDVTEYINNVVDGTPQGGGFYNTGLTELTGSANQIRTSYNTIANKLVTFAESTRADHMVLLDPLRFTNIKGENLKILQAVDSDGNTYNFSQHYYWPLRYQFMSQNTSYAATYNIWGKVYDSSLDNYIWIPPSAAAASVIASSSEVTAPWYAPAGFNRGVLTVFDDISVYSNQKQRDQLYKISINPIAYFVNDGIVVWGQKTLQSKASAFDRINVRRLFLYLEKSVASTLKYYVFEPNTYTTRTQVYNTLNPIFKAVQDQDGMYEYQIICDSRNNTNEVIDNNEMVVDIYIAPVKAAEYILCNFYATRTGGVTTTVTTAS